ncbi:MAG: DUF3048 domain-containing protein [Acidimicrobiia bacterium]
MRRHPLIALALASSLALAACGGGDDEQQAVAATTTTTAKPTTTTTEPEGPVVSMLTGLPSTEDVVARPVVAVKFDNVEGRSTPQVGIAQADAVYEVTVEGQVTRFLALYQSQDAEPIGPIRSARGSEIGLLEELHAPLFTWHGANALLDSHVRGSDIVARSFDDVPELFYRESGRRSPYNSFAVGTAQIRATAPEGSTGPEQPILRFAEPGEAVPSPVAVPATSVSITFPDPFSGGGNSTPVRFEWDGSRYLRYQAGHPHVDGAGTHLAFDNVIVRFTEAVDSGTVDQAGSRVPTAQVIGEGEAWVFSAGKVATGTWSKPDGTTPTTYRDQQGDEIVLTPGTTWIALPYGPGSSFR